MRRVSLCYSIHASQLGIAVRLVGVVLRERDVLGRSWSFHLSYRYALGKVGRPPVSNDAKEVGTTGPPLLPLAPLQSAVYKDGSSTVKAPFRCARS